KGLFTRHVSVKALSGPVGIAQQIDVAASNGTWSLVRFMSFISLQLGIFNLLPIPILDGGMILFLAIESLMRRDLNQQIKERVYQLAFVCLIMFAVFVFYNGLARDWRDAFRADGAVAVRVGTCKVVHLRTQRYARRAR